MVEFSYGDRVWGTGVVSGAVYEGTVVGEPSDTGVRRGATSRILVTGIVSHGGSGMIRTGDHANIYNVERVNEVSNNKFQVGDKVRYTYVPDESDSGWFGAEIVRIGEDGRYVGKVFDIGQASMYAQPGYTPVYLGDDTSRNLSAWVEPDPVKAADQKPYPELIGVRPVETTPTYVAPFETDGSAILDANGNRVGYADGEQGWADDEKLAEVIVLALNKFFEVTE